MSAAGLPPDPFTDDLGLGSIGEIINEAGLLWPALEEARRRGTLIEAVLALGVDDLRSLVAEVAMREAFKRERFGEGER